LEFRLKALKRMAARWETAGGVSEASWRADASTYLWEEKIFESIQRVDSSMRVRWVMPAAGNTGIVGMDLTKDNRWPAAERLGEAAEKRQSVLSPVIRIRQGGWGFVVYVPVSPPRGFDGFTVGVVALEDFLRGIVSETQGNDYHISVTFDDQLIYSNISKDIVTPRKMAEKSVTFNGRLRGWRSPPRWGSRSAANRYPRSAPRLWRTHISSCGRRIPSWKLREGSPVWDIGR
jgi:sensor domain CHASE-containing protein